MSAADPVVRIVDDDPSFLRAVARLLRAAGHAVETFRSGAELLDALPRGAGGCVVVDLRMPGMSGLELQEALARSEDPLPVVFLSGHGDVPTTVRALKHGAEDFLTKRAPRSALLDAVARALARDARERADRLRFRRDRSLLDRLTPREREVLAQVLSGKPNKQIAWDLSIHERTVKLHRTSLTRKLGVASVAELARFVQASGLAAELPRATCRGGDGPGADPSGVAVPPPLPKGQ
jgi:FixJ family two-component response regulator